MPDRARRGAAASRIPGAGGELSQLVLDYAKQETLGPLKGLARFVIAGLIGSSFLALGVSILLLGGLRALQTETGSTFSGNRNWLPYVVTAGAAVTVAGLAGWRIARGPARRAKRRES